LETDGIRRILQVVLDEDEVAKSVDELPDRAHVQDKTKHLVSLETEMQTILPQPRRQWLAVFAILEIPYDCQNITQFVERGRY
jgi:hypothetical protein